MEHFRVSASRWHVFFTFEHDFGNGIWSLSTGNHLTLLSDSNGRSNLIMTSATCRVSCTSSPSCAPTSTRHSFEKSRSPSSSTLSPSTSPKPSMRPKGPAKNGPDACQDTLLPAYRRAFRGTHAATTSAPGRRSSSCACSRIPNWSCRGTTRMTGAALLLCLQPLRDRGR